MKKIFTLLTVLTAFSFVSHAQNGKITGVVVDGSQKIIESATISLLKAKDSAVVKFTVTSKEGAFAFDVVENGKYLVSITAVGHQKGYSPVFEISSGRETVQLKTIELVSESKS